MSSLLAAPLLPGISQPETSSQPSSAIYRWLGVLFSSDYMPHGHCYLWQPRLVWLHAISDSLTGLSYTVIPFGLYYFIRRRKDLPFNWMFSLFALFIIACGATHFM